MNITINCQTDYMFYGNNMAFSADWNDETHRYHVWIGLRQLVEGSVVPYPVKISETIYKNALDTIEGGRLAPTIKMNLNAAKNAKIKAEIKRLATHDALMKLYNERRAAIKAFDKMHAEADRLNAIFNALRLLETATGQELDAVRYPYI